MLSPALFSPAWVATLPAQPLAGVPAITAEFDVAFGTLSGYGGLCFEWTVGGIPRAMNIAVIPSQFLVRKVVGGTPTNYDTPILPNLSSGVAHLFQFKWDGTEVSVTIDAFDGDPGTTLVLDTGFAYDGTSCDVSIYSKASVELGHFKLDQDGAPPELPAFWTDFTNTREIP